MSHGVDECLKHGPLAELRLIDPGRYFGRSHQHVPPHKVQCFRNLLVERPFNITGVGLIVDIRPLAGIADGLYVCVGHPLVAAPACIVKRQRV